MNRVDIAFLKGDERTSSFKIEIITDVALTNNSTALTLTEGVSSGLSDELEPFIITNKTVGNRIRITSFGNSVNLWNSITEVKLYGNRSIGYKPITSEQPYDEGQNQTDEESQDNYLQPSAATTGITAEHCPDFENLKTVYTGDITTTSEAQVIEYMEINGRIRVDHDNVVIKCVKIIYEGYYAIENHRTGKGTSIENTDLSGMKSAAIIGSYFTLKRSIVHNSGADGIKPYNDAVIEGNYFTDLGYISTAHADGIQMVSGGNVMIRGNYFDMIAGSNGYKNSQCMIISTNNAPVDNVIIEKNFLRGGGYCIQVLDKGNGFGNPTNIKILDNTFYEGHQFGELRLELGSGAVVKRNTNIDTGESLAEQEIN